MAYKCTECDFTSEQMENKCPEHPDAQMVETSSEEPKSE